MNEEDKLIMILLLYHFNVIKSPIQKSRALHASTGDVVNVMTALCSMVRQTDSPNKRMPLVFLPSLFQGFMLICNNRSVVELGLRHPAKIYLDSCK